MKRRTEWIVMGAAVAIRLWLSDALPVQAIGWAAHDDILFLRQAESIVRGDWLGPYSEMTLIKGSGYPLWIALISMAGIPLLLAQQLLYAASCLVTRRAVAPLLPSAGIRLTFFLVLLFNPVSFSTRVSTRVFREGIYPALTLLVFAGIAGIVLRAGNRRSSLPWMILTGLAGAMFWITREEGVWILPLFALAGVSLVLSCRTARDAAIAILIPASIFCAGVGAVVLLNWSHYGVARIVDLKEKSFLLAYGSLTHVRPHGDQRGVPVPAEVRERVYAVSPAFAELKPYLEGDVGRAWIRASEPVVHGDMGGGWFMYAFRDAVAHAGYYRRGFPAVREYYTRLSREIENARLGGKLDARAPRATHVPPLRKGQRAEIIAKWGLEMVQTVVCHDVRVGPVHSLRLEANLPLYRRMTHERLAPEQRQDPSIRMQASVSYADGPLELAVEGIPGFPFGDVAIQPLPKAEGLHFSLFVRTEKTNLVLTSRGQVVDRILLGAGWPQSQNPKVRLNVEKFERGTTGTRIDPHDRLRIRLMRWILQLWKRVFPFVLAASFLLVCAALFVVRARGPNAAEALLIAGLFGSFAARSLILSAITVTSFPAFNGAYESPGQALLPVLAVLSAQLGLTLIREPRLRSGEAQQ